MMTINKPQRFKYLKLFPCFVTLFYSCFSVAQKLPAHQAVQLIGGYSKHGSGDLKGIVFGAEYINYISKKFFLTYNFRASINDGKDVIIVNNTTGNSRTDASVRFTTAGVQTGVNGGLNIIKTQRHELMVSLGAFGRYQSASNGFDGYSVYYPQSTGQPTVLIGYDNTTPQKTFSFGGIFQCQYDFIFLNKTYIGFVPGFQTDTNGDAILQLAIVAGKRF